MTFTHAVEASLAEISVSFCSKDALITGDTLPASICVLALSLTQEIHAMMSTVARSN